MEIKGKLFAKLDKEVKTENFTVQEVVLDCSHYDMDTGEKRENFVKIQFSNKKIEDLQNININDKVNVSFYPKGRFYEDDKKQTKFVQNLAGYKIEKI